MNYFRYRSLQRFRVFVARLFFEGKIDARRGQIIIDAIEKRIGK